MEFKDLFRIIQRSWKTIAAFVVAALLVAVAASFLIPSQYRSTARVFIATDAQTSQDAYAVSLFTSQRVKSYAALVNSQPVMQQVIKDLSLHTTPSDLAKQVSATVPTDTVIIELTGTGNSAANAQRITQATAQELGRYVQAVETPRATRKALVTASIVGPANLPTSAISPNTELNVVVALTLGLLIGVTLVVVRESLDSRSTGEVDARPAPASAA